MASLRLQEAEQLRRALEDYEVKTALRIFFLEQSKDITEKIRAEVRKSPPDTLKLAQYGGRLDAYETAMNELRHFVDIQLREAVA